MHTPRRAATDPTNGHGPTGSYTVPTARMGGIWAPGGLVVDGDRLLAAIGNGASTTGYDGSDAVVSLDAQLRRTDFFAPSSWARDNATDADLGSMTPVRIGRWVLADGKSGTAYLLDAAHLGGIGGQHAQAPLCRAFGAPAVRGTTAYVPCVDGLRQLTVGSGGTLRPGWRAALSGAGSPVTGGGAVWTVDTGRGELLALDPADGHVRQRAAVGGVPHFASPTLSGNRVLLGTLTGVTAYTGA